MSRARDIADTGDNNLDDIVVDGSGNVGIGTSSPSRRLQVETSDFLPLVLKHTDGGGSYIGFMDNATTDDTEVLVGAVGNDFVVHAGDTEKMRVNSSGNLLVGNVGSIGNSGTNFFISGTADSAKAGILFSASKYTPMKNAVEIDNQVDIGSASNRYDDIFATNGTIQTSDANEKQQIAPLTDAEITAAKAISALFKTYKWNSAVDEKGDAARTHTGVVAQDVQQAMTDAGLDAGDYAFFISSTWWETQTEVPAVEAVAEVLDDDGNVITEAVEAQEAYIRTDTYDTAEEAPEGAVERTRLGVRYPELLAFVGAATEQRLANIETRLAALENV